MSVEADIPASTDLLGKHVDDLQENIVISPAAITGTLKDVSGYTGFSGDVSEQSGHYLALHCTATNADSITVELENGTVGHPVTLDSDGLIVIRITNKATQKVIVTALKGSDSEAKTYTLTGLTLA